MKISFNLLGRVFQIKYFKIPQLPISGYTSRTFDGQHVLFLDYDMVAPEIVHDDLDQLSEHISHAFVFTTHEERDVSGAVGNYHVICVDKRSFTETLSLMSMTHSDTYHKDLAKQSRYRSWVLRFTGKGSRSKPKFLQLIHFNTPTNEQSNAHIKMIELLYPETIDAISQGKWQLDKSKKAIVTHYNTLVEKKA